MIDNLLVGLQTAVSLQNLGWALLGCIIGTLVGVLPGFGAIAAIAMLLPLTYQLDPTGGVIMLAGLYYGSQYGGSTTSILLNLPGETSAAVTALEGHKMAMAGRGGPALAVAAIASFAAGCAATLVVAALSVPLARVAVTFGSSEYFALMILGLIGAVVIASGSAVKALAMVVLGLLLGTVGTDINSGVSRFTMGYFGLAEGVSIVALAMGLFGLPELITKLERPQGKSEILPVGRLMPSKQELMRIRFPIIRGTALGSALGVLPGAGPTLAAFSAYVIEKKISRHRAEFGSGAVEGVAAPEAANNAAAQASFIPTLALGIPGSATMALIMSALVIHNIQPGPLVMTQQPQLVWGLIVSMFVGNLFLIILNLPLVGVWVSILKIPFKFLYPSIIIFASIGVYSMSFASFDVMQLAVFGFVGLILLKLDCEPAPLLLGFVLGPMMEEKFRRALMISRGDFHTLVDSNISISFYVLSVLLIVAIIFPAIRSKRENVFEE